MFYGPTKTLGLFPEYYHHPEGQEQPGGSGELQEVTFDVEQIEKAQTFSVYQFLLRRVKNSSYIAKVCLFTASLR